MPFDPRIIRAEEPPLDDAGELVLPEELAELAAQLGDDAQSLSVCYPARSLPAVATSNSVTGGKFAAGGNSKSTFHRIIPALAAAALVTGLLTAVASWRWAAEGSDEPSERSVLAGIPIDDASSPEREKIVGDDVRLPAEAASVPRASELTPSPAFFLQEYSGPELEGIYDLLGESRDDKISI